MENSDIHVLDLEFKFSLQIAQSLMKQMFLADDRRVCDKYIRNCLNLKNSEQVRVKLHRNRFFNYLLKTMKRTVANQKMTNFMNASRSTFDGERNESKQWSPDQKTYVAMKMIPGFGTLIYMACTDDPDLGWFENGFSNFIDISEIPNIPIDESQDSVSQIQVLQTSQPSLGTNLQGGPSNQP